MSPKVGKSLHDDRMTFVSNIFDLIMCVREISYVEVFVYEFRIRFMCTKTTNTYTGLPLHIDKTFLNTYTIANLLNLVLMFLSDKFVDFGGLDECDRSRTHMSH